ncbi:PTS sugar transporter subunit IIB [Breznakia pachnodae]|uniref:PTS system cellobiose-specific IIB component n=1 Tax=Breznakia pachnodae TaxID=265178 RepID=A0ABU0E2J7_9FIRM|nr:PTS sugar transporter subunit IIB [Breznakia pachnodae]MDQ0361117.1 PTS system cellobiose-specific IIB component [Breznakia pachnodae]
MKKIMLVCAAGMSTSLMVDKMKQAAESYDELIEIFAMSEAEARKMMGQVDVIMLGPQVSYVLNDFTKKALEFNVPVTLIQAVDYGRMNGEKVLKDGLSLIEQ